MYGEIRSRRLLPDSGVCSGRLLLKVHCGALEGMARAWRLSWAMS